MNLPKLLLKAFALTIILSFTINSLLFVPVIHITHASSSEMASVDLSELIRLHLLALVLSDVPVDLVQQYNIFNTLYIYKNGTMRLENRPLIPGDIVLSTTNVAREFRQRISTNTYRTLNETGVYLHNSTTGEVILALEFNNESWDAVFGEMYNSTIGTNTVIYWRTVYANLSNKIAEYRLIYLLTNITSTRRLYVALIGEVTENTYNSVYILINYGEEGKSILFGDWIALPEGAESLSDYLQLVRAGLLWLRNNVYSTAVTVCGDESVPVTRDEHLDDISFSHSCITYLIIYNHDIYSAYSIIADYLLMLSQNVPNGYNLPVHVGYTTVIDPIPITTLGILCIAGIVAATVVGLYLYGIEGARLSGVGAGVCLILLGVFWNVPIKYKVRLIATGAITIALSGAR